MKIKSLRSRQKEERTRRSPKPVVVYYGDADNSISYVTPIVYDSCLQNYSQFLMIVGYKQILTKLAA